MVLIGEEKPNEAVGGEHRADHSCDQRHVFPEQPASNVRPRIGADCEVPPSVFAHLISSSARSSIVEGMVRPSA